MTKMMQDLIIKLSFIVVGWFEHKTHFDRMAGKVFCLLFFAFFLMYKWLLNKLQELT